MSMVIQWRYFFGAALLVGYFSISRGVPWQPVMLGIAAIAAWNLYREKKRG